MINHGGYLMGKAMFFCGGDAWIYRRYGVASATLDFWDKNQVEPETLQLFLSSSVLLLRFCGGSMLNLERAPSRSWSSRTTNFLTWWIFYC